MQLTDEQKRALEYLKQGLDHHDCFGAVDDDSAIFIDGKDSLFELPYTPQGSNLGQQFTLGHLRDIISILNNKG